MKKKIKCYTKKTKECLLEQRVENKNLHLKFKCMQGK